MLLRFRYFNGTSYKQEVTEQSYSKDGIVTKIYSFSDMRELHANLHDHNCAVATIELEENLPPITITN